MPEPQPDGPQTADEFVRAFRKFLATGEYSSAKSVVISRTGRNARIVIRCDAASEGIAYEVGRQLADDYRCVEARPHKSHRKCDCWVVDVPNAFRQRA